MDILSHKDTPAMFISRDGASRIGLKVLAKLPSRVKGFKVLGPVQQGGDKGYHLLILPTDPTTKPAKLVNRALDLLL